jgi:hypothetical protein
MVLESWGSVLIIRMINSAVIINFVILNTQIRDDSFMAKLLPR